MNFIKKSLVGGEIQGGVGVLRGIGALPLPILDFCTRLLILVSLSCFQVA